MQGCVKLCRCHISRRRRRGLLRRNASGGGAPEMGRATGQGPETRSESVGRGGSAGGKEIVGPDPLQLLDLL